MMHPTYITHEDMSPVTETPKIITALYLVARIGLALTLVFSGVVAAVSIRHATKRWSGFGELARKAPYFSGGLILLVGLYVGYQGLHVLL